MAADFPLCVIDNSFLISAVLSAFCDDEENSESAFDFLEELISNNGQIYVPQLFWFEMGNVLLNAAKPRKNGGKSRISQVQLVEIMQLIGKLPIYTDCQPDSQTMQRIMTYAQEYSLSFYDAAYVELAKRYDVPLKTFDRQLAEIL